MHLVFIMFQYGGSVTLKLPAEEVVYLKNAIRNYNTYITKEYYIRGNDVVYFEDKGEVAV